MHDAKGGNPQCLQVVGVDVELRTSDCHIKLGPHLLSEPKFDFYSFATLVPISVRALYIKSGML